MTLSQLSISELEQAIRLMKERVALLAEIASIDNKLAAMESGQQPKAAKAIVKAGKRRKISAKIIAELEKAGEKGIESKVLAKTLSLSSARLSAWFATHRKKKGIRKLGRGKYGWVAGQV
jgi:hypothetical protein